MTKALMRMMRRTTLPTTDTSNTVELAPSPIMGAGTEEKGWNDGEKKRRERRERERKEKGRKVEERQRAKSISLRSIELPHMKEPVYTLCLSKSLTPSPTSSPCLSSYTRDNGSSLGCVLDHVIIMRCCLYLHYKGDTWAPL